MKDALTIDFDDEEAILHLRIPKRNKRPDDVVLISGHKSRLSFYNKNQIRQEL